MPSVLLIEADEGAVFLLDSMFTSLGYELAHCAHPHEALFSLQDDPPDLLLLSMPLSGMTATTFLSSLQTISSARDLPVVGLADEDSAHDAELKALVTRGITAHLLKPVSRDDLSTMLSRLASPGGPARTGPADEGRPPPPPPDSTAAMIDSEDEPRDSQTAAFAAIAEASGETETVDSEDEPRDSQTAAFAAIDAATGETETVAPAEPETPEPEAPSPVIIGPKLQAFLEGDRRLMAIEMAIGKSLMTVTEGEQIPVGTEFGAELAYRDPAPGRNRMIKLNLKLRVGNCTPAGDGRFRCSLRVDDVRPAERWAQFVRVCKAATAEDN